MFKKLVQCKDCGKEVSRSAKTCPYCGAKKPVEGIGFFEVVGLLILLAVLVAIFSGDSEGRAAAMKDEAYLRVIDIDTQPRCALDEPVCRFILPR